MNIDQAKRPPTTITHAVATAFATTREVDRTGTRSVVGKGSVHDLFVGRELKQQIEAEMARITGHRVLPWRFTVIPQAMGLPKGRSGETGACLQAFVEDMKAHGLVAKALERHGIQGASVAPAGAQAQIPVCEGPPLRRLIDIRPHCCVRSARARRSVPHQPRVPRQFAKPFPVVG